MSGAPPDLPGVRHDWVDAGGLRTHVALAGPEDAPPLLLVHGWPQHWWIWREVIGPLAAEHRVIAPDLRGYGWTDAPRGGYDKEQFATDMLAVLDALGVERAAWIGHDWGAWTGFLAALRAPERIDRLVAFSIPHLWNTKVDPGRLAIMLGYQGPISLPLVGPLVAAHGMVGRVLRLGRAKGRFTDEEMRAYTEVLEARPHVTVATYRTFLLREIRPLLAGRYAGQVLGVPTSVVVGTRDVVAARGMAAGPVRGQPNVVVELVDGIGHFLPEEASEVAVDRVLAPA